MAFQYLFSTLWNFLLLVYSPQSQAELDKLTCYYYNRHLLLVIKPVKIELASLNPYIYLLYDIIRDDGIEYIKDLAAPRVSQNPFT